MTDDIYQEPAGAYPAEWAFAERSRPVAEKKARSPQTVYLEVPYAEAEGPLECYCSDTELFNALGEEDATEMVVAEYKLVRLVRATRTVTITPVKE